MNTFETELIFPPILYGKEIHPHLLLSVTMFRNWTCTKILKLKQDHQGRSSFYSISILTRKDTI